MYNDNLHCQLICLFQVRSCAMETIVEVYRHVGVKVRTDLGKRSIPGSRMAILNAQFDAIDKDTNAVEEVGPEVCSVCVYVHAYICTRTFTVCKYAMSMYRGWSTGLILNFKNPPRLI